MNCPIAINRMLSGHFHILKLLHNIIESSTRHTSFILTVVVVGGGDGVVIIIIIIIH